MLRRVYRPDEVAALMRVSKASVYRYCEAGVIPSIRIAKLLRIPIAAFHEVFPDVPLSPELRSGFRFQWRDRPWAGEIDAELRKRDLSLRQLRDALEDVERRLASVEGHRACAGAAR